MTALKEQLGSDFPLEKALAEATEGDKQRDHAFEFMKALDEACINIAKKHGLEAGGSDDQFEEMTAVVNKFVPNMEEGLKLVNALKRVSAMAGQAAQTALTAAIGHATGLGKKDA